MKRCLVCEAPFKPKARLQIYCSNKCNKKAFILRHNIPSIKKKKRDKYDRVPESMLADRNAYDYWQT